MTHTDTLAAIDLIGRAAGLLDDEARALRECHTTGPAHNDWSGQPDAHNAHDELMDVSTRLRLLARHMRREATQDGIAGAATDAQSRRSGMIVCHAVSDTLLPAVEAIVW